MLSKASRSLRPIALGSRSGWYIVIPIRDVRVRERFDLVVTLFECFLRRAATCLRIFVIPRRIACAPNQLAADCRVPFARPVAFAVVPDTRRLPRRYPTSVGPKRAHPM